MKTAWIGLAASIAAIALAAPASSQDASGGFQGSHHGGGGLHHRGDRFAHRGGGPIDGRIDLSGDRRRRIADASVILDSYGGEWALYNNRGWEQDSYNDWWHDRPERAFPRWVQEQRGGPCAPDRMWWTGSGWHC
jgi:hypothetical protein